MWTIRAALVFAVALSTAAVAEDNPAPTEFPGTETSVKSPGMDARVYYTDPGPDAEGIHNYKLIFRDTKGHETLLTGFIRSVAVEWSPSGKQLFVNDYIGSNIADCLIVRATEEPIKPVSLQDMVAKSPGRPKSPETPDQAHYGALCQRWIGDMKLAGTVAGHVDGAKDGHAFDHPLTVDLETNTLSWQ